MFVRLFLVLLNKHIDNFSQLYFGGKYSPIAVKHLSFIVTDIFRLLSCRFLEIDTEFWMLNQYQISSLLKTKFDDFKFNLVLSRFPGIKRVKLHPRLQGDSMLIMFYWATMNNIYLSTLYTFIVQKFYRVTERELDADKADEKLRICHLNRLRKKVPTYEGQNKETL